MTTEHPWFASVRRSLAILAELTQTRLPATHVIDGYLVLLRDEAGGHRSPEVIREACRRLSARWKYPSFPKVADILEEVRSVRTDPAFIDRVREHDAAHLLEEDDRAHKGAYSPDELRSAQAAIDAYYARLGGRDNIPGGRAAAGASVEREQGGCDANLL